MNGLDTTNYSTYSAGSLTWPPPPGARWSEAAGYTVGGGAAATLDDTRPDRREDPQHRRPAGAADVTIDIRNPMTSGTALAFLENKAVNSARC